MVAVKITVLYKEGQVRNFIADEDILLVDFCRKIGKVGRISTIRAPREVPAKDLRAELLDQHNTPVGDAAVAEACKAQHAVAGFPS